MAKITIQPEIGANTSLYSFYSANFLEFTDTGETSATYEDVSVFNSTIVFTGSKFTFEANEATGGKVTGIEFFNSSGDLLLSITDANLKLEKLAIHSLFELQNYFQSGNDTIKGTDLSDTLGAGLNAGNDTLLGMGGDDYLFGSSGNNKIDGGSGIDTLNFESAGLDAKVKHGITLDATKGSVINPWNGHDTIKNIERYLATGFSDTMKGSSRDEEFDGMGGADKITGGKGDDTFLFSSFSGKDTITDFGTGNDVIKLSMFSASSIDDLNITSKGGNAVITFDADTSLTLLGVKATQLVDGDFQF